jgi:hypothetical protein
MGDNMTIFWYSLKNLDLIIKIFSKSFPWYQCYHIILLLNHLLIKKTLYEGASWSPYSLIMDYYMFLGTPLKVHYIMVIQEIFMNSIQCNYIIYYVVILSPFSF